MVEIFTHTHTHTYIYIYGRGCVCACVHMHTHMNEYMFLHLHTFKDSKMLVHMPNENARKYLNPISFQSPVLSNRNHFLQFICLFGQISATKSQNPFFEIICFMFLYTWIDR